MMIADSMVDTFLLLIYEWVRLFFHAGIYPNIEPVVKWGSLAAAWMLSGFMAATIAEMKGHNVLLHFAGGLLAPYLYPVTIIFALPERFGENAIEAELEKSRVNVDIASYEVTERIKQNRIKKRLEKLGIDADTEDGRRIIEEENQLFARHNEIGQFDPEAAKEEKKKLQLKAGQHDVEEQPSAEDEAAQSGGGEPVIDKDYLASLAVNELGVRDGPFNMELKNGQSIFVKVIVDTLDELAVFEIVDHNGNSKRLRIKYDNIAEISKRL